MADIVDSYSEANQDDLGALYNVHPTANAWPSAQYQSFTGNGRVLHSCKFYLQSKGSPGNLIARLYAHTGTFGTSSAPTGAALDSSDLVDADGIRDDALELVTFSGFSGYMLVNGTKYCIVIEGYDGTWTETTVGVIVGRDGSSPTHGGNPGYYANSAWNVNATKDNCFYVYGVTPAPVTDGDLIRVPIIRKS